MLDPMHVPCRQAAAYIQNLILRRSDIPTPIVGIICGSGLAGISEALDSPLLTIPYRDVPGFPAHCTVPGHKGEMVIGHLRGIPTLCFRGRFHSYEGHSMATTVLPVKVMRCLGVKLVVITNAAGGIKANFNVGDVAIIRDHIALPLMAGKNPLVGPNDEEMGPRFPPTSNTYDPALQSLVVEAATELGMDGFVHTDSTYAFVSGPNYESRSECSMLRLLGAHAVGMSTVPEILAAHHAGMSVVCPSLITNKVVCDEAPGTKHASHEEVLGAVKVRGAQVVELVAEVVKKCGEEYLLQKEDLPVVSLETKGRVDLPVRKLCPCHNAKIIVPSLLVACVAFFAAGVIVATKLAKHN